ncbi:MAG: hypothetical protein ABIR61_15955 [Casimicrobiaceae bacterium]
MKPLCRVPGSLKYALTVAMIAAFWTSSVPAHGQTVEVEIVDRTSGERLPIVSGRGERWVVGVPGHEYLVRIRNRSGGRVLAVTSVDGVNVVTGETAAPAQSGYVLDAAGTVEIGGWRKSLRTSASFYFTDLGDAYASRTGRPDNVGVIGVAVFRERVRIADRLAAEPIRQENENAARDAARGRVDSAGTPAESKAAAPAAAPSLGTGHGREENAPATRVAFERASHDPVEVVTIRYDRRENLVAMGILPPPPLAGSPRPFPEWRAGFVPDPPAR